MIFHLRVFVLNAERSTSTDVLYVIIHRVILKFVKKITKRGVD